MSLKAAMKRAAPVPQTQASSKKKQRKESSEELNEEEQELEREMNRMLGGGAGPSALRAQLAALENDEEENEDDADEEEEDSEENEFFEEEDMGALEGDSGDEDMIDDDGEDLLANVNDAAEDSEDEDASSEEATPPPDAAPLVLKKANTRNSKAAVPLKPAELRALAFAELTASPISTFITTQVTALLAPITPPAPSTSPLHPILKDLHAHITSLPSQKAISLEGLRKKGKLVVPGNQGGKWDKIELNWEAPRQQDVRIVGSWAWGGAAKGKNGEYIVEMAVGMPASLLQLKDYLSPRFLAKSTHYLVTIASQLPASLGAVTLSYTRLPGSQGYALDVRSAHKKSDEKIGLAKVKGAVLRIRAVWVGDGPEGFPTAKMNPTKNLVRPQDAIDPLPATPLHASSLQLSSLPILTNHLKHFHSVATTHSSFTPTVQLLQSWATLRGFGSTLGLTGEFWAWCVARTLDWGASHSSSAGAVAGGGEAWAGWRKSVEWLAGVNWTDGMFFRVGGDDAYAKEDFRSAFKGRPIFIDPSGKVNLAAGIDLATLEMLKQDAKTTIALLLSSASDEQKFEGSFLRDLRVVERFDNFARIAIPASYSVRPEDALAALDFGSPIDYLVSSISTTLHRALGTRARAFQLIAPSPSSIPAKKGTTIPPIPLVLNLGILLDGAEAGRLVDQGPPAEDEAACVEFRSFWGSKSELRRFKDGAILESVVWDEVEEPGLGQQRNKVVSRIVKYILESRNGIAGSEVEVFAGVFDRLLVEPESLRRAIYLEDSIANNKGFGNIMGVYDALAKELTGLDNLPLTISAVSPSSPGLRYSTIFTPSPRRLKDFARFPDSTKYIEAHDVILTMEGSGRWPEDLEGIQKIKAAFLAKIAEQLGPLQSIFRAQVVFDIAARPTDDNVSLEILTATGFAFRARIHYDRSLLIIKSRASKMGATSENTIDSSLDLYNERFVHAPRHHAALATLQHHFTSYSPTVRLVKRWFSAHMLSPHFPTELIELLVASVFLDSTSPYEPPSSGATGFARVMEKLSSWKWKDESLLVPLYTFSSATTSGRRAALSASATVAAQAAFELRRLDDPVINRGAWFIATEEDVQGRVWGHGVGKAVAGRARGLARATLNALNEGVSSGTLIIEQLFSAPLGDYAFLLHLDPSAIPRHFQAFAPDSTALTLNSRSSILSGSLMGDVEAGVARIGLDPVAAFVKDLETLYPSTFLLFYSTDGGSVIGGIWNPSAEASRPWSVGLGFPVRPVTAQKNGETGKAKVVLDKVAVLQEMERIGKGLVSRVEILRE